MAEHECSKCERSFDSERGLKIHMSRTHSTDDEKADENNENTKDSSPNSNGINVSFRQFGAGLFVLGLALGLSIGLAIGGTFLNNGNVQKVAKDSGSTTDGQQESDLVTLDSGEYPYGDLEAGVGEGQRSFGNKTYELEGEPYIGSPDAEVTMISYEDFECPFCKKYNEGAFPQIRQNFIEAGDAQYYFKNLPLRIHPWAEPSAIASECALNQDEKAFWSFKKGFFSNQDQLGNLFKQDRQKFDESMYKWAEQTGLDVENFKTCYDNKETLDEVQEDQREASSNGARATPTIMVNSQKLEGAQPYSRFKSTIEAEMR